MTADYEPTHCWSCGKPFSECICDSSSGYPSTPLPRFTPQHHLPSCGSIPKATLSKEDQDVVAERPCCACHRTWPCTYNEWINGTCPHCGASGPNPTETKSSYLSYSSKKPIIQNNFSPILSLNIPTPSKISPNKVLINNPLQPKNYPPPLLTSLSQYSLLPEDQD